MANKTLYTAIGRFERREDQYDRPFPVIILGRKEYMVNVQEMAIWAMLNWRIVKMPEISALYEKTIPADMAALMELPWESCLQRLLTRGLVIYGSGETEYDALYDLLSPLYIIPACGTHLHRIASFFKLALSGRALSPAARQLFRRDSRTSDEKQVMALARQALLSTAEIIKCVEKGICRLPDDESILEGLYDDQYTTSDNICYLAKPMGSAKPITAAVANLYLRRQVIFERI